MKIEVSVQDWAKGFKLDNGYRTGSWTVEALEVLGGYLEETSEDGYNPYGYDIIAIQCDWAILTARGVVQDYGYMLDTQWVEEEDSDYDGHYGELDKAKIRALEEAGMTILKIPNSIYYLVQQC